MVKNILIICKVFFTLLNLATIFLYFIIHSNLCVASTEKLFNDPKYDQIIWTDEKEKEHHLSEWKDKNIIITLAYGNCQNTCPNLTFKKLKDIQKLFDQRGIQAEFLIATMDPNHDTPRMLMHMKERWGINRESWHLLRATPEETLKLAKEMGVSDYWQMDDHIIHRFKILYIDAKTKKERVLDLHHQDPETLIEPGPRL